MEVLVHRIHCTSKFPHNLCAKIYLINVDDVRKHELLLLESRNHPKNGGRGHRKEAILEDRGGLDRIRHPEV